MVSHLNNGFVRIAHTNSNIWTMFIIHFAHYRWAIQNWRLHDSIVSLSQWKLLVFIWSLQFWKISPFPNGMKFIFWFSWNEMHLFAHILCCQLRGTHAQSEHARAHTLTQSNMVNCLWSVSTSRILDQCSARPFAYVQTKFCMHRLHATPHWQNAINNELQKKRQVKKLNEEAQWRRRWRRYIEIRYTNDYSAFAPHLNKTKLRSISIFHHNLLIIIIYIMDRCSKFQFIWLSHVNNFISEIRMSATFQDLSIFTVCDFVLLHANGLISKLKINLFVSGIAFSYTLVRFILTNCICVTIARMQISHTNEFG